MESKEWDVNGKVVLVTGGANGVGAGLVRELLARNARHVAFFDIAEREGSSLENELNNKFGPLRAKFIKCNISDDSQINKAYEQILDKYRRLDVVVNNAAILSDDEAVYKAMVDVNLCGTVTGTLKALGVMRADKGGSGGTVINVSSLLAFKPSSHLPVYGATKAAILQFTNYLSNIHPHLNNHRQTNESFRGFFCNVSSKYDSLVEATSYKMILKPHNINDALSTNLIFLLGALGGQSQIESEIHTALLFNDETFTTTKVRLVTVCLGPTDTALLHRHNVENFNKNSQGLTSRVSERQRVESAVSGIIEVIYRAENGSTWIITNDKPAADVTRDVNESFRMLSDVLVYNDGI